MKIFISILFLLLTSLALSQDMESMRSATLPANAIWLESLNLKNVKQDWATAVVGKTVNGNPITLGGIVYPHGVGSHAESRMVINLKKSALKFETVVGLDDEITYSGSVNFEIWVDGTLRAKSKDIRVKGTPEYLWVDLKNAKQMVLMIKDTGDGIDCDHADWAGARIHLIPGTHNKPVTVSIPPVPAPRIQNPVSSKPTIHGPRITGTTPGNEFLFLVPATGASPLTYSADSLPEGLNLNHKTGIITGTLNKAGTYPVLLKVKNPYGTAQRTLTIVGGFHKLALTPPMGWNSWNVWGTAVDEQKVKAAADWMVKSGLAAHGYQYINIDDAWEGERDTNGEIMTNKKFPDMKALADYVHSKGLKLGIYSSPGPKTCGDYEGSYQHEQQDANTYAKWGIDFLKYDWCAYNRIVKNASLDELQKPYITMRKALDNSGRDIVYSLCQYGMGDVWTWGESIGANLWRTTGDITDHWGSMTSLGFQQTGYCAYAGPGHWNDPDMMVVGKVGWGPKIRETRLNPVQQMTHVSLWSLLAAPMLLGCDLSQMDKYTLDLLTNDEVLDINQDPLGKAAMRVKQTDSIDIWLRPLSNRTYAVGIFNKDQTANSFSLQWRDIGLNGNLPVRDVWQHKNLGDINTEFKTTIPGHGVVLLIIGKNDNHKD